MTDVEGVYDENEKLISEIKSTQAEKLIYRSNNSWRNDSENKNLY